tara:strand:+ start:1107 stop:1622 length:516 start_codon:yes stop_codon:yes gene_type:complete
MSPYGKIKADAFIYDNSGSDVEVAFSTLGTKANLASPAFTGTPTAPTAATSTNTTQLATTAFVVAKVAAEIADLVASAPSTLDTLNELAAALGDDANFSTTVTNSIATKLALAGGTMTGAIAMGGYAITGLANPTNNQDAATKASAQAQADAAQAAAIAAGVDLGTVIALG